MTTTRYASIIHLGAVIGTIFTLFIPFLLNLWVPLGLWLIGPRSSETDWSGREAVRFQLFMLIYMLAFGMICFIAFALTGGLAMLSVATLNPVGLLMGFSGAFIWLGALGLVEGILALMSLIFPIIAAVQTNRGENYVYPFTFSPRRRIPAPAAI